MFEQFMADYIKKCVDGGYISPIDICQCAKDDIEFLDQEIRNLEALRTRQSQLRTLIRKVGGSPLSKAKQNRESLSLDFSVSNEKLDNDTRLLCVQICNIIENNTPITVRDIIDSTSYGIENSKFVYIAIKWLVEQGYLARQDDISRAIIKGDRWEDRPTNEENY